jgi:type II secretion system protein J
VTRLTARGASGAVGFTLLEVILSLMIFSMLTLMVYSAFFIGHRAVLKGERDADQNQRMRVAEDILGREVRSAVSYQARHDDDTPLFFLGHGDGMTFVTAAPQARGGTGLAVVTYRVVDGQLILEERVGFTPQDLYRPPRDAHVERAVLLSGFASIRFEYMPHDDTQSGWQRAWDAREEEALPVAVRMTVEGLPFFGHPWIREIPLMTVAYGLGNDDTFEPDDEEENSGDNGDTESDNEEE